jgi:phytoene synthase
MTSGTGVEAFPLAEPVDGSAEAAKLAVGYKECGRLTWRHGTTYFWGAALLPKERRRHVYAVYALCRLADDIVDDQTTIDTADPADTAARLEAFAQAFRDALATGSTDDPVLAAIVHSVRLCAIDPECFDRFFAAMAMDLTTTTYETWEDLLGYMEGSAAGRAASSRR